MLCVVVSATAAAWGCVPVFFLTDSVVCRHGGTPNLSEEPRSLPNVEYFAPWFRSEYIVPSMPYERWEGLSEHGQRISRFVVVPKGEAVIVRRRSSCFAAQSASCLTVTAPPHHV